MHQVLLRHYPLYHIAQDYALLDQVVANTAVTVGAIGPHGRLKQRAFQQPLFNQHVAQERNASGAVFDRGKAFLNAPDKPQSNRNFTFAGNVLARRGTELCLQLLQ